MDKTTVFVLKDSQNYYVGCNSIISNNKQYMYSHSKSLINGFYTYSKKEEAENDLIKLRLEAKSIGFDIKFHIEKIDIIKTILEEKIGSGIQYVIIRNGKVQVA